MDRDSTSAKGSLSPSTAFQTLLAAAAAAAITAIVFSGTARAADPLMDRTGRTLSVAIDGKETTGVAERDIRDSAGLSAYTIHWSASLPKSPHCFKLQTHDARLGKAEKIDVMIHEIRPDRPFQNWKNYQTVPSPAEALAQFSSEKGFCPTEYILTERLRYPSLPAGDYVLRVAYWGEGNWDRQDIYLKVEQ